MPLTALELAAKCEIFIRMTLDRDELNRALVELAFDVHHFRCYAQLYRDRNLPLFSHAAYQAVLYSLLIHLRLLLDFFYGPAKHDDCWVGHFKDYIPSFSLPVTNPPPDEAREVSVNLNKRLAHFTATRWRVRTKPMDFYRRLIDQLDPVIGEFEAALPPDMKASFEKGLRRWSKNKPFTTSGQNRSAAHGS